MGIEMKQPSNRSWSFLYSITSLRQQWIRNVGIVFFLALNVALPTTVFAWSNTSAYLVIEDHFNRNSYQLLASTQSDVDQLIDVSTRADEFNFIEEIDFYQTTAGILTNATLPTWLWYSPSTPMPAYRYNDFRTIAITNEKLSRIKGEFVWDGVSHLDAGQVLISERLVYHASRTYGLILKPGMIVGVDVLLNQPTDRFGNPSVATWSNTEVKSLTNLTIAGIYKLKSLSTLTAQAFPAILRPDPWPEHMNDMESVLGLEDSVMILDEEFDDSDLDLMAHEGFFNPKALFRASIVELLEAGSQEIEENLLSVKEVLEEKFSRLNVIGATTISDITTLVETYARGQMFTLVAVPVMLLSIFITIFTAESSLSRRKVEISVLRSKGASFNQITASIMWEACILSVSGFLIGLGLAVVLAPVLGSSNGFFNVNMSEYIRFFTSLRVPPMILMIAGVITMYLPGLYLYQIERRIDVHEVGVPLKGESEEKIQESRFKQLFLGFVVILSITIVLPYIISPQGISGTLGIIAVAIILLIASYLGSRVVQLTVSSLIGRIRNRLGERVLYVVQSLRRRRGKFVPLMVILTLSLTSATMMLMESSSFQTSLQNDVVYSYGADIRLDCIVPYNVSVSDEIEHLEGVNYVTPVLSHLVTWQSDRFFLKGIYPLKYLEIGTFGSNTFPNSNPSDALHALYNQRNGVIVSESYASRLNKTVGDTIRIRVLNIVSYEVKIVATMTSAPGFGYASTFDAVDDSIASNLGFQVLQDGFMLVNYNYLSTIFRENEVDLFLVDADLDSGFQDLCANITSRYRVNLRTPHWNILPESEIIIYADDGSFFYSQRDPIYHEIQKFISGLQGITLVGTIVCILMAMAAVSLFFGSAVTERTPEYAIFRALGATENQIYTMVFGEFSSLVYSALILSVGLGIIFGYTMTILVLGISPFVPILQNAIIFPIIPMAFFLSLETLVLLISCYYPAIHAGRVNMNTELRNL